MTARYEFIDGENVTVPETGEKRYSLVKMCSWMDVSTSGFYEWWGRPQSATAKRRVFLRAVTVKAFEDSDGTYGYRRLHAQLARWGVTIQVGCVRSAR